MGDLKTQSTEIVARPDYPTLELDMSLYQGIMDDPSVPDDKKRELLESLWAIAVACVDLGLGLHPLQQACGQFELYNEVPNMIPADMVDCNHTVKPEFEAVNPAGASASDANQSRREEETHDANR